MGKKKKGVSAPSGLQISRSGTNFTLSWKRGASYNAQELQISYGSGWRGVGGIGGGTTSKTVGYGRTAVFRVRGRAKVKGHNKWSGWAQSPVTTLLEPYSPAVKKENWSESPRDSTVFSWEVAVSDSDARPFTRVEWESVLVEGSNTANWDDPAKENGSGGATGSWTKSEAGVAAEDFSYTRWFRARAVGPYGASAWIYEKRIFSLPAPAQNVAATRIVRTDGGGFTVAASWDSPATETKPIDKVTVRYLKSAPDVSVTFPTDVDGTVKMEMSWPNSSSASWTALSDVSGVGGKRGLSFTDLHDLEADQCLFLQVNNSYNELTNEGTPILVENGIGKLANPSVPTATYGGVERVYEVSVTRNTAVNEAAIAVYWRSTSTQDSPVLIGIIEGAHDGQAAKTSTQCLIPEFPDGDSISFGVQAFIGDYSPVSYPSNPSLSRIDPTYYEVTPLMKSEIIWGEGVPLPPRNVAVIKINDNTVQVGWTWSWTEATSAELSWADHEDAWESTSEPQTYNVNSNNAGRWNITGLSIGTWYIRVRLFKKNGDTNIYGAYSTTQIIKLASSPDTPSLVLSSGVIPKTGSVTCYWAYVSTDGTAQRQGEVCEAFPEYAAVSAPAGSPAAQSWYELIDGKYIKSLDTEVDPEKTYYYATGQITYGEPIASTSSAQQITIHAEEQGWDSNETHYLAVRVMSVSGEPSEGWSVPVPVSIAEEPSCSITSHQFVEKSIPIEGSEPIRVLSLTALPTTVEATGVGLNGTITYILERATSYDLDRPDGSEYQGFEGETVFIREVGGTRMDYEAVSDPTGNPSEQGWYELSEDDYILTIDTEVDATKTYYQMIIVSGYSCTINQEDLIGALDDGASYNLIAIAKDSYGQTAEDSISFEVHWDHQAVIPDATVEIDTEHHITTIIPSMPESGYAEGDVCDIYRLSADDPELIVSGAQFGTKYVDPYPAFGDFGGIRVVYRTVNGDYITDDNTIAWHDYNADDDAQYMHNLFGIVIDFDGEQLILPYNVSFNNSWSKDFTTTKYLGGSIQGDWNPAVEKSISANTTVPINLEDLSDADSDIMRLIRELAVYPDICHVRLPDGSSFTANVEVKDDREEKWTRRLSKISLNITYCESQGFEGMTYEEWINERADD